jgi:hypothetical protein
MYLQVASLPGSDALKKGRSESQASMSAHDRAMVATSGFCIGGQRPRYCEWPCGRSDLSRDAVKNPGDDALSLEASNGKGDCK